MLQEGDTCINPRTGMDDDTRCGHGEVCFRGKCVERKLPSPLDPQEHDVPPDVDK